MTKRLFSANFFWQNYFLNHNIGPPQFELFISAEIEGKAPFSICESCEVIIGSLMTVVK
jgi:hypothetical protein